MPQRRKRRYLQEFACLNLQQKQTHLALAVGYLVALFGGPRRAKSLARKQALKHPQ